MYKPQKLVTVHMLLDINPDQPMNMSCLFALELIQAAPVTLDTSHFEMPPSNALASLHTTRMQLVGAQKILKESSA